MGKDSKPKSSVLKKRATPIPTHAEVGAGILAKEQFKADMLAELETRFATLEEEMNQVTQKAINEAVARARAPYQSALGELQLMIQKIKGNQPPAVPPTPPTDPPAAP